MKQTYQRPEITVIHMEETVMQTLSTHVGPGPSPGGGLAKPDLINDDSDDSDEPGNVGYNKMWED